MAYRVNPFLERMSERTTSDQEFVRLFSPKILEQLSSESFQGKVHLFISPPGGGKTTLLRAFTPTVLRAFSQSRRLKGDLQDFSESADKLIELGALDAEDGPILLSVYLSCAAGYADLPPGVSINQDGIFRSLVDCRIVLRTLRSLASLLGSDTTEQLDNIRLEYGDIGKELKSIPQTHSPKELIEWAELKERNVYEQLDNIVGTEPLNTHAHVRFEGILWLQSVKFIKDENEISLSRLIMLDDLQKLRNRQRTFLIEELTELRSSVPVWLSCRSSAFGEELLSPGSRQNRDIVVHHLGDMWKEKRGGNQFSTYAQNILDRRLYAQNIIPPGSFSQYLREQFNPKEMEKEFKNGVTAFRTATQNLQNNFRYGDWLKSVEGTLTTQNIDSLIDIYKTRILLSRDLSKRQQSFELSPLSVNELEERDSSSVESAAEIFIHDEVKLPYYFGVERLCVISSYNVEELLAFSAELFNAMQAKRIQRKSEYILSPKEQEKCIKDVTKRKHDFIPKSHTEGRRAQKLLDAIGLFCREKTFQPNAPYAPGVTGIRLSNTEIIKIRGENKSTNNQISVLRQVISESVAENLLITKDSAQSTAREDGTVFYLSRTLCAYHGLPLGYGGWQDISVETLIEWMVHGYRPKKGLKLEME